MWKLIEPGGKSRGNLMSPRSYCPHCRQTIPPYHLIPIVSYLILRGACHNCGKPIAIRYPLVEIAAVGIGAVSLLSFGPTAQGVLAALYGWILLALGVIDWETGYLPDWLTLSLLIIGLGANVFGEIFTPWRDALIGAAAGAGFFWAISAFYASRGKEALGLGDAKLLGAVGAWLGWQALPMVVLFGSLASLGGVLAARLRGTQMGAQTPIPFGPGLCAAGLLMIYENLIRF